MEYACFSDNVGSSYRYTAYECVPTEVPDTCSVSEDNRLTVFI